MTDEIRFCFNIQWDGDVEAAGEPYADRIARAIEMNGARVIDVERGKEEGPWYAAINVQVREPVAFWQKMQGDLQIERLSDVGARMIVVCQGEFGWDDYLLLYHFDQNEELDKLK